MNIILSESLLKYKERENFNSLTVTSKTSGGSCCRIVVPSIKIGEPESSHENFNIYTEQGLTIYITKNLELKSTITFSYEKMLGKEMLEMHGYIIKHRAEV